MRTEVASWSLEDVQDWLSQEGFGEFVEHFAAAEIDGAALLHLRQPNLQEIGVEPQDTLEDLYGSIRALQDEWSYIEASTRGNVPQKRSAPEVSPNGRLPLSAKAPPKGSPPWRGSIAEPPEKRSRIAPSSKATQALPPRADPPRSKLASGTLPSNQPKAPLRKAAIGKGQDANPPRSKQPSGKPAPPKAPPTQVRPQNGHNPAGADEGKNKPKATLGWYNAPRNPAAPPSGPKPPAAAPPSHRAADQSTPPEPKPKKPASYGLRPELLRPSPAITPKLVPTPPSRPPPSKMYAAREEDNAEDYEEEEPEEEDEQAADEEEEQEDYEMEGEDADADLYDEEALEPSPKASASIRPSPKSVKDILVIDGLDLAQNIARHQGEKTLLNSSEVFHVVLEVLQWLRTSQPESTLQAFLPRTLYLSWEKMRTSSPDGDDIFRSCLTQVPSENISGALLQYIVRKAKENASIRLVSNSSYDTARFQDDSVESVCNSPIGYCFTPDGEFLCPDLPEPSLSSRDPKPTNGSHRHAPQSPAAAKRPITPMTPAPKASMAPMTPAPKAATRTTAKPALTPVAKVSAKVSGVARTPPKMTSPIGMRPNSSPIASSRAPNPKGRAIGR